MLELLLRNGSFKVADLSIGGVQHFRIMTALRLNKPIGDVSKKNKPLSSIMLFGFTSISLLTQATLSSS